MAKSKLLICLGTSEHSISALKFACFKAKKNKSLLEIMTVVDTAGKYYQGLFSIGKVLKKEKREEVEEYMKDIADKAFKWSGIKPIINIREGYICDEITTVLENDKSINMIILGTSHESTSNGKLIPYITEQLSSKFFVPLVVIPHNLTDSQITQLA